MNALISKKSRLNGGFALITTILLMVLLAIITVGTLSLSVVTLRNATQDSAQAHAKANARMALMIAIGELQKHAGPDTRITAPADIVSSANPPLLGVWHSWEGSDNQSSGILKGRPLVPDYASKTKAVYEDGRFVSWLVSGAANKLPEDAASLVQQTASAETVPLLAAGTLADSDTRQVHCVPQKIKENGAIAWWISGENQKARIPKPDDQKDYTVSQWADVNRSHAVADPKSFDLDTILADPALGPKALTRNTADLIAGSFVPSESFHDLSADSIGLLTNVATGGWKKDFSLLTENWDAQPTTVLKLHKLPGI